MMYEVPGIDGIPHLGLMDSTLVHLKALQLVYVPEVLQNLQHRK
jgi:hypothetical protein